MGNWFNNTIDTCYICMLDLFEVVVLLWDYVVAGVNWTGPYFLYPPLPPEV